uniref:Secreted protein n=1 Tax=Heterorhabditis bacteriophora TaxID=37862 RepID=A0A1I7X884_HETBA
MLRAIRITALLSRGFASVLPRAEALPQCSQEPRLCLSAPKAEALPQCSPRAEALPQCSYPTSPSGGEWDNFGRF